jgi:tetratricopeptide (TPR) repeat protein
MINFSFCAIVKNEAKNLARCLASVKPYVDELIVVDTGSMDDTVAIAQQYGAKISHFEWRDDFSAARNFAIAQASGQWILTLDADEELIVNSDHCFTELVQSSDIFAYTLPLKDFERSASTFGAIRLFQNISDFQYVGSYHESICYQSQLISLDHPQVRSLENIEIVHYGYTDDALTQKASARIPMLENIREREGLSLLLLLTLAGLYKTTQILDHYSSCCSEAFERLLPHLLIGELPEDTRSVRSWLYCLGVQLLQDEDYESVRILCHRGLEWFPDYPPLSYLSGLFLKITGFLQGSIPYFEHCLDSGRKHLYFSGEPFDLALITNDAAYELGTVYLALGNLEQAIAAFTLALSFDPNHAQAQEQLEIAHQRLHANQ